MRQGATRAVANRRKRSSPKKITRTSPTKAKQPSPKKVKGTSPKKITRTPPKSAKPISIAAMQAEISALRTELQEARDQQTAAAEVLGVINSSPGDLAPVFNAMLQKALGLCEAAFGVLWTYDGQRFHGSAMVGVPEPFASFIEQGPHAVGQNNAHGALLRAIPWSTSLMR